MKILLLLIAPALFAAAPQLAELEPRGAERGRPFTLTITGRNLGEGSVVVSGLPATFTPLAPAPNQRSMATRYATFLVEPKPDTPVGVYPIRVQTPDGISNVLLFTIGSFPELAEEESRPGVARPNSNDSIESAQALPNGPLVVNGKLSGPERDLYRITAKAGERRVFEVEARRSGSAIDPVIRVLDASGKAIARSEDALGLSLDARVDVTFPKDGNYYLEVHDARFSAQEQNFYRLKMGAYPYADELFPLGGRRGEKVDVTLSGAGLSKPIAVTASLDRLRPTESQTWINLPDAATLPLPLAVGEYPELREPTAPAPIPSVINGRLTKEGERDRYRLAVKPGQAVMLEVQARELGTSKLIALLTVEDAKGQKIAQAGDEPILASLTSVGQSQTARDPYLRFTAPADASEVIVSIEDLARRGGPGYAYRLIAREQDEDFSATIAMPLVNIPRGGTAQVVVNIDRRGLDGPVHLSIPNLPAGISAQGGLIPAEGDRSSGGSKVFSRRGVLTLTAAPDAKFDGELEVWAEGKTSRGATLKRRARGLGFQIGVAGASAQGVVDRQRALTAPWLGAQLPAAVTTEPAARLVVTQVDRKREVEGDRYQFTWKYELRPGAQITRPDSLNVDLVGINDIRIIDMKRDAASPLSGSFVVTTTKVTMPSLYDLIAVGRVTLDGIAEDIYAPPIRIEVTEIKNHEAAGSSN